VGREVVARVPGSLIKRVFLCPCAECGTKPPKPQVVYRDPQHPPLETATVLCIPTSYRNIVREDMSTPDCGKEFEPYRDSQKYCCPNHKQRAYDRKNHQPTATDLVIASRGRACSNCRDERPGQRRAFWWDSWDRYELVMETALLLCPQVLRQDDGPEGAGKPH